MLTKKNKNGCENNLKLNEKNMEEQKISYCVNLKTLTE